MECENCEKPAVWIVKRRTIFENIQTGETIEHPNEPYQEELMTDFLCDKCARASYGEDLDIVRDA